MADIDVVAENLVELLTNTVDMAAVFYDIFLNPNPMDVSLKMFNDENKLITVTIPNRAKDRVTSYTGEGSPEGVVKAPMGSTYIDTLTSTIYYKVSGESDNPYGWNASLSQSAMEVFIRTYLEARGYITYSSLNTYLRANNYVTTGDVAEVDSFGVVKIDGGTIVQNENNQISTIGIVDANGSIEGSGIHELWTGSEEDYRTLYLNGDMNSSTIYVLKDKGQILIGDTEVSCNTFPSGESEEFPLSTSGQSYTAPTNGWFLLEKGRGNTQNDAYLHMINDTSEYADVAFIPSSATTGGVVACPALKGETVTITFTDNGDTARFLFINAEANRVSYTI